MKITTRKPSKSAPKLDPRAKATLLKVIKKLEKEPESYDQKTDSNSCGSPRCIVGHMRTIRFEHPLLYLTFDQFRSLYIARNWPRRFYRCGFVSGIKASTAIARIKHFIKTDGEE